MSDKAQGMISEGSAGRIRVMIYQPNLNPGGAQKITLTLLQHLDRERFAPMLVVRQRGGDWLTRVPTDVPVIFLDTRVRSAWNKFKGLLQRNRPDVLLSMSSGGNLSAALAHYMAGAGFPLVLAEHNNFSHAWQAAPRLRFHRVRLLKHILYKRADRIIAVSSGVGRDLIDSIGIKPSQLVVIHNPIVGGMGESSEGSIAHPWFTEDIPIILAAGRLVPQKDYPTMLDAFCRIRRQKMARLVILGDGELRGELENMARSMGVGDDVAFLGFVPHPSAYMKRCSVFVMSSRFEGLPTVLVEAMASGAPVVSTDCPSGPNEIISSGDNGVLVPVGDSQALADAILSLLDDECLRDRIRERGRQRALTFSVKNAVNRYEELFGSLVNNHKNTGFINEEVTVGCVAHREGIV